MKLGKKPHVPDSRDIKLSAVLDRAALPTPPERFGYGTVYPDWLMLGNDRYGDCVWAGQAHQVMGFNKLAGHPVTFTTSAVLSDYSACTGFDPHDPNTDQGTDVRAAVKYWQTRGVVDGSGNRHKVGAYAWLTPGDYDQLMQACFLFEFVGIGVVMTQAQMDQFNAGEPWDHVAGSPEVGGHYVVPTGRRNLTDNGLITWGRRQSFTRAFYEKQCDEAVVCVTQEELANGVNRRGLSLDKLNAALAEL